MKTLANYIITNLTDSSDWNDKFYQKNDGTVEIYIANKKHDVTDLFNFCLNEKGMFVRSDFEAAFKPLLNELIEKELDAL